MAARMVSWVVELSEYDIQYVPRGSIKSQALKDLVVEFSSPIDEETPLKWAIFVDGTSNMKVNKVGIVLEEMIWRHTH